MANQKNQAPVASTAGEAVADQDLATVLKNTVHAKVLAVLDDAINSAIVETVRSMPGEHPVTPDVKLAGAMTTVTRPKEGGVCAAVWTTLDKLRTDSGEVPTLEQVRKVAKKRRWNANNARIEYYRWRAANGITRASSAKTSAQVAAPGKAPYKGPDRRQGNRQEARA